MTDDENTGFGETPHDLTPEGAPGGPMQPGQYGYMVHTGKYMFVPGDPTGLAKSEDEVVFSVIVDGPYSENTIAERAADLRLARYRSDFVTIKGPMEPYAHGLRGPHAGIVEWKRDLTWHDHSGKFGDKDGWQTIKLVYVDELP